MSRHCRAAWQSGPDEITLTLESQGGGEYLVYMPKRQAEQVAAELFAAMLEDHASDADADR